MRTSLILLLAIAQFTVSAQSSAADLVLAGTTLEVNGTVDPSSGKDVYSYNVQLYLQLHNRGSNPVIVFRPDVFFGTRKLEFLNDSTESDEVIGASTTIPWISPPKPTDPDPLLSFVKIIDALEPNLNYFAIVQPGGYFEFRDRLTVNVGYEVDDQIKKRIENIRKTNRMTEADGLRIGFSSPTSKFSSLRIQYSLSLKKHHQDLDFLRRLQQRWKPVGNLLLDESGNFILRSQLIVNKQGR